MICTACTGTVCAALLPVGIRAVAGHGGRSWLPVPVMYIELHRWGTTSPIRGPFVYFRLGHDGLLTGVR